MGFRLNNPPALNKYNALKKKLLDSFTGNIGMAIDTQGLNGRTTTGLMISW